MEEEFKIVKLADEHFDMLLPLYKEAFGKVISKNFLKRKFDTSMISEEKNLGFIAINQEGKAAAFYGAFVCYALINGKSILIAQSGDTMVSSKYRRKKLFVKLALATYEYCKENGIKAVFGFPNIYSFPSFVKKLGWNHSHNILNYERKTKCIPLIKLTQLFKLRDDFFLKYQLKKLRKVSTLVTAYSSVNEVSGKASIKKNDAFISYKGFEEKYFVSINNIQVWLKPSALFLFIGDISKCREDEFLVVVSKLEKLAFGMGIPQLRIQTSAGSVLDNYAKRHFNKMDAEYPAGGISFDTEFDINCLNYVLADNDTF